MADTDLSRLRLDRRPAAARTPASWLRRLWLPGGALVLASLAGAWWWQRPQEVETVSITTAYPYQGGTLLNAAGYVVAGRKAAVASKATGRLEWLGVAEGSRVKAGEVLARLEDKDVAAQVDQAGANLRLAEAEVRDASRSLARSADLARQKFLSPAALDSARARADKAAASLAVARAGLQGAKVAVEQTLIRAPFDGVVLTKTANIGDVITPFSSALESKGAVLTMADMDSLEVEADVAEANLAKIQVGLPCEIQLDAFPGQRFRGEVSRLVPTVDRAKATVLTKVRFVDRVQGLLPEMSAKVAFLEKAMAAGDRAPLVAVHKDALAPGGKRLFLIREGRLEAREVMVGRSINDLVTIEATPPLEPGTKVVARPGPGLSDGDRVKVVVR